MTRNKIELLDCLQGMKHLPANSIDCCVTDPPYGIGFMNKKWDYDVPSVEIWQEVKRILKPGAHALVACGTRTQHRKASKIEDAGFEIRNIITWHYGTGFPKSQDLAKAQEKKQSVSARSENRNSASWDQMNPRPSASTSGPKTDNAGRKDAGSPRAQESGKAAGSPLAGWGTALKPATEFWTLARKPLDFGSVVQNVLAHGVGGLNIDGARIDAPDAQGRPYTVKRLKPGATLDKTGGNWRPG
jgi:hypothetical protein